MGVTVFVVAVVFAVVVGVSVVVVGFGVVVVVAWKKIVVGHWSNEQKANNDSSNYMTDHMGRKTFGPKYELRMIENFGKITPAQTIKPSEVTGSRWRFWSRIKRKIFLAMEKYIVKSYLMWELPLTHTVLILNRLLVKY